MDNIDALTQNCLDVLRVKVYFWAQYLNLIKITSKHGDDYFTFKRVFKVEDLLSDFISIDTLQEKGKDKSYIVLVKLKKDLTLKHITFNFEKDIIFTFPRVYITSKKTDTKQILGDDFTYPNPIYFDPIESSHETAKFDYFPSTYTYLNFRHFYLGTTNFKEIDLLDVFEFEKLKIALEDPCNNIKIPNNCNPHEFIFLLSFHPTLNDHSQTYGFIALSTSDVSCFNITHRYLTPSSFKDLFN